MGLSLSAGSVSCATSSLGVGTHHIYAVYSGDSNFTGYTYAFRTVTVSLAHTSTTLVALPASPVFGQTVSFTATVGVTAPGSGVPSGTVTLYAGNPSSGGSAIPACSGLALSLGSPDSVSCTALSLSVGAGPVYAQYSGDSAFSGSTSSAASLKKASTTLALTPSTASLVSGQTVSFTATVSVTAPGSGAPTGSVTLYDGDPSGSPAGTAIATCTGLTLSNAVATCATNSLSIATHHIYAIYSGDSNFTGYTYGSRTVTVRSS
jgi:hypothetical protein